jgi:hypothetical protein
MPGNDTDVKKYLATCLQSLREDYTKLNRLYEENRSNSAQKLEQAQQVIYASFSKPFFRRTIFEYFAIYRQLAKKQWKLRK